MATKIFLAAWLVIAGALAAAAQVPAVFPQVGYPFPAPVFVPAGGYIGHGAASVRTRVTPRETQIFVDGFTAGIADDFDGVFQRLQLVPGKHEIALYLPGYQTYSESVYLVPNRTHEIRHTMIARRAGEADTPPPTPMYGRMGGFPMPAGQLRFGALLLGLSPADATVLVDGAPLAARGTSGAERLAVQLSEGRHRLQIEKAGFEPFSVEIDIRGGETTSLNVTLQDHR